MSPLPLRSVASHKTPAAGAEQETEIIPATVIVYGVDRHIVVQKARDEADGGDEAMQKAAQESVLGATQAFLYGFLIGAGDEEQACKEHCRKEQEGFTFVHKLGY